MRWDPAVDLTVTIGGAVLWATSELLEPQLAPSRCRWCSVDALDDRVRTALVWRDTNEADTISDVTGFALVPLAAFGLNALAAARDGALGRVGEDSVLIAEAGIVTVTVNQLTKMVVARERPFVHALPADRKRLTATPSDNDSSFMSGHASGVFALTAAAGTIGTMHGYRWTPLVWGVGGAASVTTAYLRIAADMHWLTDVVAGAVVGSAIGCALPLVFHPVAGGPPRAVGATALRAPFVLPWLAVTW
jgi:membrane-associated phospholipid phosphatase